MNFEQKEFSDLLDYIDGHAWPTILPQILALWTAYCIHQDYEVDTRSYDEHLRFVYDAIVRQGLASSYESFYNYMSLLLV